MMLDAQETRQLRKQMFRASFCTKQISVLCGGLGAHTIMQCGSQSGRLPARCRSVYNDLRNRAHTHEMESPNKSAAVARVLEGCKSLVKLYCKFEDTARLLQCLQKTVPSAIYSIARHSRCTHALSNWKSQEGGGLNAVQAGQLFQCGSNQTEVSSQTNGRCVDGFALSNVVTYQQRPSIEARHIASVTLICKEEGNVLCPGTLGHSLALCLYENAKDLTPECQKALHNHRHFSKWKKVVHSSKALFARCKKLKLEHCPRVKTHETEYACLLKNYKRLPSACRKQVDRYAQM